MFSRKALLTAVLPLILFSVPSFAWADESANVLEQVRSLTIRCVVQPVRVDRTGHKILDQLRSTCVELQASGARAQVYIGRVAFQAVLTRSELADGNDLNHLFLYYSGRPVAQLRNVAAFGNIFIALAGGMREFREIDWR